MKKPVVDYRTFRLRRLNEPQFAHLKLLLGWLGYFILYFLTENLIPVENCHPVHMWLDDLIPFCEWFLISVLPWYRLRLDKGESIPSGMASYCGLCGYYDLPVYHVHQTALGGGYVRGDPCVLACGRICVSR